MKKKTAIKRKPLHRASRPTHSLSSKKVTRTEDKYVILVRSWVFLVLFAMMLGIGVIVGNYINAQLNGGAPTVAGISITR